MCLFDLFGTLLSTRMKHLDNPQSDTKFIKYGITRREYNAGYKIRDNESEKLLANIDRESFFNLDTTLFNYKVEIRKGGSKNAYYKIRIGDSILRLEFSKFKSPFFHLHGKKYKWKFRKFFFFKTPMRLYLHNQLVAKYSIAVFPVKKMGVLKLYKQCPDFEKAAIIATSLCIVHYDSRK
eukprot:NODE_309_length_10065_cov_0.706101.p9 type:complete len:180 gc:universal NODE_309_length_10065_cov_0.706101:8191-8730(+)